MGVTLADISREAGVSITTVSKVLAGKGVPFRISKKTQEKIWRVARELDYAPDLHARSLRAGRSNQIGIVVAHFNDPWYGQVIHGLEAVFEESGYGFLINSVEEEPDKLALRINRMRANRVEGLIIVGSRLELPRELAELLHKAHVPVVLVNRKSEWPGITSIVFDHVHTGKVAAQHLLDLGHRRIGMLLGPQNDPGNASRLEGFRAALASAQLDLADQEVIYAEPLGGFDSCRNGYNAMKRVLERRPDLTAIIAFDDSVAIGAMRGAVSDGLRIPEDLSVVGVDDSQQAEFANPPLTTVRLPSTTVGQTAARIIVEVLASKKCSKPDTLTVRGELVVRESTAPPRCT